MFGWNGVFLQIDLSKSKAVPESYSAHLAENFLGGRGFAVKILWDRLEPKIDPLSPKNILVFAAGPLTGFALPSSGKIVVAAKSPLTGGYGDGNLGSYAAVKMREVGYDAIIIGGKAEKPSILLIQGEKVEFLNADDLWGLGTFETEGKLREKYGRTAGILCIGPGGENLVKFANVVSQRGRAGGRPGMGAVMGSKNLKAVVIADSGMLPAANVDNLKKLGMDGYREVLAKPNYALWKRQGTMMTIEWSQENSVLPTYNYREGVFEDAEAIGGFAMEKIRISNRGCPQCNMTCGNVINDSNGKESELDYENVAMLGSNIGLGNLREVATLNRIADDLGLDTISLGNIIGFAMEASERKLIQEKISWGEFKKAEALSEDIAYRRGLGNMLAEGVRYSAEKLGGDASRWAMHVKGLEISAYNCHTTPAMALSYATSSIGAHHKDAWVIAWEAKVGRESYSEEKVDKVIELQRIRAGVFECLTVCRFPWIELGFELEWYPKFLEAATGLKITWEDLNTIADRVFNLTRAFWIREHGQSWANGMDVPPARWFEEPLSKGPFKGAALNREGYENMLRMYYRKRGWDERGIPTKTTLKKLGLHDVAEQLEKWVKVSV